MKTVTQESIQNKKVLVRLDLDVPLDDNANVTDLTRLESALPTLNLLAAAKQIIMIGHLGRPEGKDPAFSLRPVAQALQKLLHEPIEFVAEVLPESLPNSNYTMLENLRYDERESKNDDNFAKELAKYAEIFAFEAFAVSHRKAASTVAITKHIPSYAGLRVTEEVEQLSQVLVNPPRPLLVILGGAKIETKLPMIQKMESIADNIFVGGKLPYEIKQQGLQFKENITVATMNESGLDIDEKSIEHAVDLIGKAKLIVWNGPVGKFEDETAQAGTEAVAQAVALSEAKKVTGGGDTIAALEKFNVKDKIDFVSVGGGAMLEFLSGKELPALEALK